ncbi:MAG: hypothetical protein ACO1OB_14875 [Archangium sp.]
MSPVVLMVLASGFFVEAGGAGVISRPTGAIEASLGGQLTLGRAGQLELRAHSIFAFGPGVTLTGTLGYRTPTPLTSTVSGNFGVGLGAFRTFGCTGDLCGGYGAALELTPRLVVGPGEFAEFYVGLNLVAGYGAGAFLSAGLAIGCSFDFTRDTPPSKPMKFDAPAENDT